MTLTLTAYWWHLWFRIITKLDKFLTTNLSESKKYGARQLTYEFPNKTWSWCSLED